MRVQAAATAAAADPRLHRKGISLAHTTQIAPTWPLYHGAFSPRLHSLQPARDLKGGPEYQNVHSGWTSASVPPAGRFSLGPLARKHLKNSVKARGGVLPVAKQNIERLNKKPLRFAVRSPLPMLGKAGASKKLPGLTHFQYISATCTITQTYLRGGK